MKGSFLISAPESISTALRWPNQASAGDCAIAICFHFKLFARAVPDRHCSVETL